MQDSISTRSQKNVQKIIQWFTIFYVIALTFLLEMPSGFFSGTSLGSLEPARGYAHLITFTLLGFLTELCREKRSFLFWVCVLILYALATEVFQGLLSPICYRTFDLRDICQNTLGIALGTSLGYFCRPFIIKPSATDYAPP